MKDFIYGDMSEEDLRNQYKSIIAKFMGLSPFGGKDTWFLVPLKLGYEEVHINQFEYDTSIDALLPVIDKIEQTIEVDKWKFKFSMTLNNGHRPSICFERQEAYQPSSRTIPHWDMPWISGSEDEPMTKNEAAFRVVAKFIIWYNDAIVKEKKKNETTKKRLATRKRNLENNPN
ncbi:unnamed protein product [marine sediment metagenome]|uniref:Uncharacterized protein n=1 Tax=marine sediment metagenome TaxID=412755 RepID=X1FAN8_9ZZZZ